ncbi:MAG: hypothetical protein HGB19_06115 [Chlorobiales bacterium]|jgi:hypothetical protein|nr:hypothetical protein [Chlorobiales bacterium]
MMRHDMFIPEMLTADEKVSLFFSAINDQPANAVVVSPIFFEEVKKSTKGFVETTDQESDHSETDRMILDAIEVLYKYEDIVAYTNEPATVGGVKVFVKPISNEFRLYN